ncbi:lipocalin/fatty-acid binding family protein [Streptomyces sp. NBC_01298]|uniref:lipocalin/fatty-acid binding family protein n=1 Tax=Streptomyces sp. NBC_01298 TaxID=2903817 RepID=UPI002E12B3FC|nr:lipocalin/fatty-acid binding family protein [Streptomyces sp. NBC_01298]
MSERLFMIAGKYDLLSDPSDKFYDEFLQAAGVSEAHREAWNMIRPSMEIIRSEGDQWLIKTTSELSNEETLFTSGVETPTQFFGADTDSVFTVEGSTKIVHKFTAGGKESQIVYEFAPDGMTSTHASQGKAAVRKYKRVA